MKNVVILAKDHVVLQLVVVLIITHQFVHALKVTQEIRLHRVSINHRQKLKSLQIYVTLSLVEQTATAMMEFVLV